MRIHQSMTALMSNVHESKVQMLVSIGRVELFPYARQIRTDAKS